jgi:predicted metallopeptidase
MKKQVRIAIIVLLVLLSIFGLYKLVTYQSKIMYFKPITFENINYINNKTDMKYADTIIRAGLDILKIQNIQILVTPLTEQSKNQFAKDGIKLDAHIRATSGGYIIWVSNLSRSEMIKVLSHELIHLKQYSDKKLSVVDSNVIWNGEFIDLSVVKYEDRPFEIEAFQKQTDLLNKIEKIVY